VKLPTDWSEISLHSERACLLLSTSVDRQRSLPWSWWAGAPRP